MKIKVIHLSKILLFLTLLVTLLTVGISIVIATSEDYIEVPIIMYHSILKDSSRSNKYTVTPTVLEEDLKYIKDKGYYTIPLENPQPLEADQRFAVIVQIYTRDSMHPIAIEYVSNELTVEADISDGESYMSYNGSLWSHMEEASACNACLKVYTDDAE